MFLLLCMRKKTIVKSNEKNVCSNHARSVGVTNTVIHLLIHYLPFLVQNERPSCDSFIAHAGSGFGTTDLHVSNINIPPAKTCNTLLSNLKCALFDKIKNKNTTPS